MPLRWWPSAKTLIRFRLRFCAVQHVFEFLDLVAEQRAFQSSSFLFEHNLVVRYGSSMTATAVIEEIKHLPRTEQSRVLRFAFELARERELSGEELAGLAQRMVDSNNLAEKKRLREEIHRGFYGE